MWLEYCTLEVVFRQRKLHHATLLVDRYPVPARELISCVPFVISMPCVPASRTIQGNQSITIRRRPHPGKPCRQPVGAAESRGENESTYR